MEEDNIKIDHLSTITIDYDADWSQADTISWGNTISTVSATGAVGATGATGAVGSMYSPTITSSYGIGDDFIINWSSGEEFKDVMPSMTTINEMCEIYPGLKKAFENFKDIYDLVKGDYEARKNADE